MQREQNYVDGGRKDCSTGGFVFDIDIFCKKVRSDLPAFRNPIHVILRGGGGGRPPYTNAIYLQVQLKVREGRQKSQSGTSSSYGRGKSERPRPESCRTSERTDSTDLGPTSPTPADQKRGPVNRENRRIGSRGQGQLLPRDHCLKSPRNPGNVSTYVARSRETNRNSPVPSPRIALLVTD